MTAAAIVLRRALPEPRGRPVGLQLGDGGFGLRLQQGQRARRARARAG